MHTFDTSSSFLFLPYFILLCFLLQGYFRIIFFLESALFRTNNIATTILSRESSLLYNKKSGEELR